MAITRTDLDTLHMLPGEDYDPEVIAAIARESADTTSADKPFGCQGCGIPARSAYCEACHLAIGGMPLYG